MRRSEYNSRHPSRSCLCLSHSFIHSFIHELRVQYKARLVTLLVTPSSDAVLGEKILVVRLLTSQQRKCVIIVCVSSHDVQKTSTVR